MGVSRARKALFAAALLGGVSAAGCSTLGYYWQAFNGQMELGRRARPIPEVVADPATGADLRTRLQRVQAIRDFASRELALPDNGSYRRYADLERAYVVWNVFAAEEFSTSPKEWCFPIAGCVGYRGYFANADAEQFAIRLRSQGYDVFVGGVPAYSTLGWMDDPILSTFVRYPDSELARLMFHELAHQVAYAAGDSTFNESFAVAVELEGVRRWIERNGTPEQRQAFERAQVRKHDFAQLVERTRDRLSTLYDLDSTPERKRAGKLEAFETMRREYQALKAQWGGFGGYDWWFAQPLNNAQLASVAIYSQLVPGFQKLLAEQGGDLKRFYAQVRELAKLPKAERHARLEQEADRSSSVM